eukprot:5563611-Pyramimonas_sp.AAC.1
MSPYKQNCWTELQIFKLPCDVPNPSAPKESTRCADNRTARDGRTGDIYIVRNVRGRLATQRHNEPTSIALGRTRTRKPR